MFPQILETFLSLSRATAQVTSAFRGGCTTGHHPREILHKSKGTSHMFAISTVAACGVRLACSGQSRCLYFGTAVLFLSLTRVWKAFWILRFFLLSFWLWKSEDGNPHSQVLHPQLFRQCQTSMSPEIQFCFWSAKQAFPQLTSSALAKQEEPERMKAPYALT